MTPDRSAQGTGGVAEQLLATKLLVPALGREVVPRPRLVERLSADPLKR